MKNGSWKLTQLSGSFSAATTTGTCDLLAPAAGVRLSTIGSMPIEDIQLLRINLPTPGKTSLAEGLEAFARGGDLVGIYPPTTAYPFRSQAYWRLQSHDLIIDGYEALAAIEAVASNQTDLLDSHPELSISSSLPATSAWQLNEPSSGGFGAIDLSSPGSFDPSNSVGCFLFRIAGDKYSYAEMVYPLDFHRSEIAVVERGGQKMVESTHHLFLAHLEKGVILRARVLGLLLPREQDMQAVAAHYAAFAASDPPLTA